MVLPVTAILDLGSTHKVQNAVDGTNNQDYVTVAQLNANIEGLNWKDSVRAASTANINLAAPGTTIDAITMATNDRFLAKNQTTGSENGIYIWNGSGSAATRSLDMNSAAEVEAATVTVEEGTAGSGTTWRQTAVNVTLGSTTLSWTTFGTAAGAASESSAGIAEIATTAETNTGTDDTRIVSPLKLAGYTGFNKTYATDIGNGSLTSFTITHNLGTKDVNCTIFENGGSFREIIAEIQHTTTNTLTVLISPAPSSNQYRVVVSGYDL
jgi:hypothetical protein